MPRPRSVVGAHVLLYVNGQPFGRVVKFRWTSMTPRKELAVIDILFPVELLPTVSRVSWEMQVVRTMADGGAQGAGLVASQAHLSREKYCTLLLVDRRTDTVLFKSDYNSTDVESWDVTPKNLMLGSVSGKGILWTNETAGAKPAG